MIGSDFYALRKCLIYPSHFPACVAGGMMIYSPGSLMQDLVINLCQFSKTHINERSQNKICQYLKDPLPAAFPFWRKRLGASPIQ